MSILLNNHGHENESWADALTVHCPDLDIEIFPKILNPEKIEFAVIWDHPHGDLLNYPNLKAILLLGAGTEYLDADKNLPDVPIIRLLDPEVGNDMAQYVTYWTMHFHRQYEKYRDQTKGREWIRHEMVQAHQYRVTILGLGRIGQFIAERIHQNGFKSQAWSRSHHEVDGVDTYFGIENLPFVLEKTDVLVNCLPLNSATHHLLNHNLLNKLPHGSNIINVSRGPIIDDEALIKCLDSGQIAFAALDVFKQEPLKADSEYWLRKNVYVTPHMSGATYAKSAAKVLADNIKRIQKGETPFPIHIPPK